jgi:hypothetical protein
MHILRRIQVAAGVVIASASVGAVSGVLVASTMLFVRFSHVHRELIVEVVKLGGQTGAALGIVLGVPITFALLRRVPLTRIAANMMLSATYGGILGFGLSLAFAQPRPTVGFMMAGGTLGAIVAAVRLWSSHRDLRRAPVLSSVVREL